MNTDLINAMVEEIIILRLQKDLAVETLTYINEFFVDNKIAPGIEMLEGVLKALED